MKTISSYERFRLLQTRLGKIETNYKMALLRECNGGGLTNARPSSGYHHNGLFIHK
ncbi:hypothetical protein EMIT0P43_30254 [Pseudomonas jessenii]|jgi:hypothetical protein